VNKSKIVLGDKYQRVIRISSVSILVTLLASTIGMLGSSVRAQSSASVSPQIKSLDPTAQPSKSTPSQVDSESSQVYDDLPKPTTTQVQQPAPIDVFTKVTPIHFKKVIKLSQDERSGETKVTIPGQDGLLESTYRTEKVRHGYTKFVLISSRVVKYPVDMEVTAGYTQRSSMVLPSRSGVYNRTQELDLVATGYSPSEGPGHGLCATGMHAGYGVVAVDPRIIPLRSKLYISGYGYAIAGDTGGAIKGHRIDLGLNTRSEARNVGRRHVHVYLLSNQ
jgi:3D (Asp-Asp-Asp) domain-containing protein